MKRKIISLIMAFIVVLSSTACGSNNSDSKSEKKVSEEEIESSNKKPEEASDEIIDSELESLGEIEVEKELFDVNITIPAEFMEGKTQEDLDASASEYGYRAVLNDDGTATYTMTKSQHKALMDDYSKQLNEELQAMVGSEEYPNFTEITSNDNFTNFTVKTTSTELSLEESFSVLAFYMYGGIYGVFNGTTVDNIHVDFVNSDSGEIIESADSSNMEE